MDEPKINPYAAPADSSDAPHLELPEIMVDGKFLVVASGVQLPSRCVKSNAVMTDKDRVQQTLSWSGKSFRISPSSGDCELTFYAKPIHRWGPKAFVATVLFVASIGMMELMSLPISTAVGLITASAVALLGSISSHQTILRTVKYKHERFWIKGCDRNFLDSL